MAAGKRIPVVIKHPPARARSVYEVRVGAGVLEGALDGLKPEARAVLVVIDAGLGKPLVEPVLRRLDRAKLRWGVCVVPATEADKSLLTAERGLAEAGRLRLERGDIVLTMGGGITCDVGGFIAATYRRGVRVVQCPTTLLAMVDAAVGGKTAVNLAVPADALSSTKPRLVKNVVGVFHQPARVVCDVSTLGTLAPRELRCGLAECLKHGLIGAIVKDARLFDWTLANAARVLRGEARVTGELVARNVAAKARVVVADPFEEAQVPKGSRGTGGRMALNLGHTFAHALETLPGLSWQVRANPEQAVGASAAFTQVGPLKHGEAVGLGLLAAARVSGALRLASPALAARVQGALEACGLPTRVAGLPEAASVLDRMMDDKKVAGGRLRLILPVNGWSCRVVENPASKAVVAAIESLRASAK